MRRVLVCGASAGIGRATAQKFIANGDVVFGLARRAERLKDLELQPIVTDLDTREIALKEIAMHLPFDVVIHNTGGPKGGALIDADVQELEHGFARHVLSAHQIMQLTLPAMREKGFGRFINVISTSVYEPIPMLGVSNTIRAAMAGWAKSLSRELPSGITINNILPGFTQTERLAELMRLRAEKSDTSPQNIAQSWIEQVPEGRFAQPEEIAEAIFFLASPQGAYIRGVSLAVDGGRLRSI